MRFSRLKRNGTSKGNGFQCLTRQTDEEFPTAMSVDYVRVWQLPEDRITQSTTVETPRQKTPSKKIPTDWTKDKYIAKETLKWSQKG
ncbi:MAG: hypothetical protein ACKVHE_22095 [Planctomycetales bacterium]|jgi:hypothetical protein